MVSNGVTFTFNEELIQNYEEVIHKEYTLEVNVKYSKELHELHIDLSFLPERMEIDKLAHV